MDDETEAPVTDIERFGQGDWMSQAVAAGGLVFLAGAVARDAGQGIEAQTEDVLDQIDARLLAAGSGRERLVSATIWLADRADFMAMNAVWARWIGDRPRPARATVEAGLMFPGLKVEIAVIAARK
jgi:enamine deaminase RidA (YjgF/YER057c/UK114 family)